MSDLFLMENLASTTAMFLIVCDSKFQDSAIVCATKFCSSTGATVFMPITAADEGEMIQAIKARLKALQHKTEVVVYMAGVYDTVSKGMFCCGGQDYFKPDRVLDVFNDFENVASMCVFLDVENVLDSAALRDLFCKFKHETYQVLAFSANGNHLTLTDNKLISHLAMAFGAHLGKDHHDIYSLMSSISYACSKCGIKHLAGNYSDQGLTKFNALVT